MGKNFMESARILDTAIDKVLTKSPDALDDLLEAAALFGLVIRDAHEIGHLSKHSKNILVRFLRYVKREIKVRRRSLNMISAKKGLVKGEAELFLTALQLSEDLLIAYLLSSFNYMMGMVLSSFIEKGMEKKLLKEQGEKLKKLIEQTTKKSEEVASTYIK